VCVRVCVCVCVCVYSFKGWECTCEKKKIINCDLIGIVETIIVQKGESKPQEPQEHRRRY
jgi:hypothetical protein